MLIKLELCRVSRVVPGVKRCELLRCRADTGNADQAPVNKSLEALSLSRRNIWVLCGALLLNGAVASGTQAEPWFGVLAARKILRPDGDQQEALVVLLDAKGTLKEVAELAATPPNSDKRFHARALLPGMAKRLRNVAQAAPVVAAAISGDKESTLSEKYGGSGAAGSSLTDPVYETVGRVLTISGRSINPEALASPEPALEAVSTLEKFLDYVPKAQLDAAQEFRVKRFSNN